MAGYPLATKICLHCQRPFTWRKKWKHCWQEVKYCSERCRRNKHKCKITNQLQCRRKPETDRSEPESAIQ
ncbi:DUF2256 domain-containing protein [Photobacterium sp. Hal280]|uniref:DUF2256 domain-containing protein n=1 Tax=Photobacterium sp. Hal280 TaxID=3035163 RepID=UPI00301D34F9